MATAARRRDGPARSRRVYQQHRAAGRRDTHGAGRPAESSAAPGGYQGLSAVTHVWVIELENQGYAQSFGTPSADPYLAKTLPQARSFGADVFG